MNEREANIALLGWALYSARDCAANLDGLPERERSDPSVRMTIEMLQSVIFRLERRIKAHENAVEASDARWIVSGLLREIDRNTCPHEDTYRGGFLWTICSACGQKWADDQGGFKPHEDSDAVKQARRFLCEASSSDTVEASDAHS